MENNFNNLHNKPYCTHKWLDNHHSVKSKLRSELIKDLPIKEGSKVLDVGSGTGLWSFLIAEQVGHLGKVVGIELDNNALEIAESRRQVHFLNDMIEFRQQDVEDIEINEIFDVITIFNTLSYLVKPLSTLKKIAKLLSSEGTILIKDSDIGSDFFWPIDEKNIVA